MDRARTRGLALSLILCMAVTPAAAERHWQTGPWTRVGIKRTPFVGDPVRERTRTAATRPEMTEVATYVIETSDRRYELQDLVAIGREAIDLKVTVGAPVTFAVEKKTVYIKLEKGEYRLLVLKNEPKTTP
jgi:hypothetical protein